jgi:hypothetical protein
LAWRIWNAGERGADTGRGLGAADGAVIYRRSRIAREKAVELVDLDPLRLKAPSDPGFLPCVVPDGAHPSLAGHLAVTIPGVAGALLGHPCGPRAAALKDHSLRKRSSVASTSAPVSA